MSETAPNYNKAPKPYRNRKALASGAAALLLSACGTQPEISVTADPNPVECEVSEDTQTHTFGVGEGANGAIHAVKGSGEGPGAACWPEAKEAVEEAIEEEFGTRIPQADASVEIPRSVQPIEETDS